MRRTLAACGLALAAACASPSPYRSAELTGEVSYRPKIAYPDATLVVYLLDVSGPESPLEVELQKLSNPEPGAELLAFTSVEGGIVSPTPFSLPVPLDKVDEGHDYALKAAILQDGRPVMATTDPPLVLTKSRPTRAELLVRPVDG
ncbi:MAG TPA: YbaY family lipoprotein [Geminicoccaceae bacterium]|nr:YbaY family lipoprotein [Geminicoccaceae bacterium]